MSVRIKCVILGDEAVGKTSLVNRYIKGKFDQYNETTIGASFNCKPVTIENKEYRIDIWDTAGQERYRAMVPLYYRQSNIVFICVDLSKVNVRECFEYWFNKLNEIEVDDKRVVYLVGTKSDIKLDILDYELNFITDNYKINYIETSSKENVNIDELFNASLKLYIEVNKDTIDLDKDQNIKINLKQRNNRCCRIS